MKSIFNVFLSIFLSLIILACKGENGTDGLAGVDGVSDKQIRIYFGDGYGTTDTNAILTTGMANLLKFNKSNYKDVDSIIWVQSAGSNDSSAYVIIQLYNLTDSILIPNTQLTTNKYWGTVLETGNIFNDLPNKEIDIAVSIRSSVNGIAVGTRQGILFLYRK